MGGGSNALSQQTKNKSPSKSLHKEVWDPWILAVAQDTYPFAIEAGIEDEQYFGKTSADQKV